MFKLIGKKIIAKYFKGMHLNYKLNWDLIIYIKCISIASIIAQLHFYDKISN